MMELLSKAPGSKGEPASASTTDAKPPQHAAAAPAPPPARASSSAVRTSAAGPEVAAAAGSVSIQIVRQPGTGLGISVAGGLGSTPFKESDPVHVHSKRPRPLYSTLFCTEYTAVCTRSTRFSTFYISTQELYNYTRTRKYDVRPENSCAN